MHSFFAKRLSDERARLCEEDARHAIKVLRLEPGDGLVLIIDNKRYLSRMIDMAECQVLSLLPENEPSIKVTLYQGLPKGEKLDFIVQKATELGVSAIVPVKFGRSVAQWTEQSVDRKLERLQRIIREASLQCSRSIVPLIHHPIGLNDLAVAVLKHELALMPWEEADAGSLSTIWKGQRDVALIIGPEGGISTEEVAALSAARPLSLGPRILRTETAALAALAGLFTLSGDLA